MYKFSQFLELFSAEDTPFQLFSLIRI